MAFRFFGASLLKCELVAFVPRPFQGWFEHPGQAGPGYNYWIGDLVSDGSKARRGPSSRLRPFSEPLVLVLLSLQVGSLGA